MAIPIQINADEAVPARQGVKQVIKAASAATGVDFDYMVATANRESSLNPRLKASTSSATGLYQFIDSTWLSMMKKYGAEHGYGALASAIQKTKGGGYRVEDPSARREIMNLRFDARANALMAGEFTKQNQDYLEQTLGREPTGGELYIAHFLGPQGAAKFIQASQNNPDAIAAAQFPSAASANAPIFYKKNGAKRTMGEVYAQLTSRHKNMELQAQQVASQKSTQESSADNQSPNFTVAQVAAPQSDGIATSFFRGKQAGAARGAVAPGVLSIWSKPRAPQTTQAAIQVDASALQKPFYPTSAKTAEPQRVSDQTVPAATMALTQQAVDMPSGPSTIGMPLDLLQGITPSKR